MSNSNSRMCSSCLDSTSHCYSDLQTVRKVNTSGHNDSKQCNTDSLRQSDPHKWMCFNFPNNAETGRERCSSWCKGNSNIQSTDQFVGSSNEQTDAECNASNSKHDAHRRMCRQRNDSNSDDDFPRCRGCRYRSESVSNSKDIYQWCSCDRQVVDIAASRCQTFADCPFTARDHLARQKCVLCRRTVLSEVALTQNSFSTEAHIITTITTTKNAATPTATTTLATFQPLTTTIPAGGCSTSAATKTSSCSASRSVDETDLSSHASMPSKSLTVHFKDDVTPFHLNEVILSESFDSDTDDESDLESVLKIDETFYEMNTDEQDDENDIGNDIEANPVHSSGTEEREGEQICENKEDLKSCESLYDMDEQGQGREQISGREFKNKEQVYYHNGRGKHSQEKESEYSAFYETDTELRKRRLRISRETEDETRCSYDKIEDEFFRENKDGITKGEFLSDRNKRDETEDEILSKEDETKGECLGISDKDCDARDEILSDRNNEDETQDEISRSVYRKRPTELRRIQTGEKKFDGKVSGGTDSDTVRAWLRAGRSELHQRQDNEAAVVAVGVASEAGGSSWRARAGRCAGADDDSGDAGGLTSETPALWDSHPTAVISLAEAEVTCCYRKRKSKSNSDCAAAKRRCPAERCDAVESDRELTPSSECGGGSRPDAASADTGPIDLHASAGRRCESSVSRASQDSIVSSNSSCRAGFTPEPAGLSEEQQHLPAYLSFSPCVEDSVPMVALECELPVSGRLSPPAECAASFLSVSTSGHVDMMSEPFPPGATVSVADSSVCRKRKLLENDSDDSCDGTSDDCDDESAAITSECKLSRSDNHDDDCAVEVKRRKLEPAFDLENSDCVEREVEVRAEDAMEKDYQPESSGNSLLPSDDRLPQNESEAAATACDSNTEFSSEPSEEVEESCSAEFHHRGPRISPFLNTPKQRKEERRKILKLSIYKMRAVEDPEHFLRRSVLINNTMKRLQRELREEKLRRGSGSSGCYGGLYRRGASLHYEVLNNSYLLHDEPFAVSENDRITDDMTDALVTRLETTPVVPTPPPSPAPPAPSSSSSCQQQQPSFCPVTSSASLPTSSPVISSSSPSYLDDGLFTTSPVLREASSCSSESQREKQLYADMDTVFNNLIRALGDS